jgi:hypothetical protein
MWQKQLVDMYDQDSSIDEEDLPDLSRDEVIEQVALMEGLSSDWKVVWKLEPLGPTEMPDLTIVFELPPSQVFNMLVLSFHDMEPKELQIPVSFSPDLRRVAILHSVVMIDHRRRGYCLQQLDEDVLKQANQYIRDNPYRVQYNDVLIEGSRWQRTIFSPNGLFLAVIQSRDTEVENDEYMDSSITVYWNGPIETFTNKWHICGSAGPFLQLGGVDSPVCFNPLSTGLVLVADEKTYFWQLSVSSQNDRDCRNDPVLQELYSRPLHNITFTDSGKYVFGICDEYDNVRITMPRSSQTLFIHSEVAMSSNEVRHNDISNTHEIRDEDAVKSLTQSQGPLDKSLFWAGDAVSSTGLCQSNKDSIILSSLTMDGRQHDAILLRIPKSLSGAGVSPTLMNPLNDSTKISLVINKEVQHKYDVRQQQQIALPFIVERQKSTIDIFTSNRCLE